MTYLSLTIVLVFSLFFAACGSGTGVPANTGSQDENAAAEYSDAQLALADGTRLLDTGETDRAIEVLNQAVKLDPDLADAFFQLGIAYALVEARDAADIPVDVPAGSDADSKDRQQNRSNSEIAFEKAAEGYKKLISANKEDHALFFNLGRAYNKLNQDEKAEDALSNAVKLDPENTEYQTEYGAILIKLARYRDAIAPLKKALELDPENVEAMELLEDAEAGRKRVSFTSTPKKDESKSGNSNVSNSHEPPTAPTNSAKPPEQPKPTPAKLPTNRP